MSKTDWGFTYEDLLECVAVLRTRAYGGILWDFVNLVDEFIVEGELKRMLSYLVRKGKLLRSPDGSDVRYARPRARPRDEIVQLKLDKTEDPWPGRWHLFTYDIPVSHNTERHRLTHWLREMGFGRIGRSSWVSPYDWRDFLDRTLLSWRCDGRFYCFQAGSVSVLAGQPEFSPAHLWDLHEVAKEYERIVDTCASVPKQNTAEARCLKARALLKVRGDLAALER